MKKILTLLITLSIVASCNEKIQNSSLENLNTQKLTLVSKIDSLNKQLKSIEKEISKLDSTRKYQIVTTIPAEIGEFKHYIEIQGVVQADKNIASTLKRLANGQVIYSLELPFIRPPVPADFKPQADHYGQEQPKRNP